MERRKYFYAYSIVRARIIELYYATHNLLHFSPLSYHFHIFHVPSFIARLCMCMCSSNSSSRSNSNHHHLLYTTHTAMIHLPIWRAQTHSQSHIHCEWHFFFKPYAIRIRCIRAKMALNIAYPFISQRITMRDLYSSHSSSSYALSTSSSRRKRWSRWCCNRKSLHHHPRPGWWWFQKFIIRGDFKILYRYTLCHNESRSAKTKLNFIHRISHIPQSPTDIYIYIYYIHALTNIWITDYEKLTSSNTIYAYCNRIIYSTEVFRKCRVHIHTIIKLVSFIPSFFLHFPLQTIHRPLTGILSVH